MGSNPVLDLTVVRVPAGPRPSRSTSVLLLVFTETHLISGQRTVFSQQLPALYKM